MTLINLWNLWPKDAIRDFPGILIAAIKKWKILIVKTIKIQLVLMRL
jgi:hypothetical protein